MSTTSVREIKEWWELREDIMATRRTLVTVSVLAAICVLVAVPWSGRFIISAIASGQDEIRLFPARASRLDQLLIADGQSVVKGAVLAILHSDEINHKRHSTERRIKLLHARIARIAGDAQERADRVALESELKAALENLRGLQAEQTRLTIIAPFAGQVHDLATDLHTGRYLKPSDAIARLVSEAGNAARGYVREEQHTRLIVGAVGRFIPRRSWPPELQSITL